MRRPCGHRIPLVALVFADGAFGNVGRIQEEAFGNRLTAYELANPDFVKFAEALAPRAAAPMVATKSARR